SSRRRHTRFSRDWSSDVCSSDLLLSLGYLFSFSAGGHWHVLDYLFVCLGTVAAWASARKTPFPAVKLAFWITVSVFSLSILFHRSEERRVGKECRSGWSGGD